MKINKQGNTKQKGRTVKEDLERLNDAGINLGSASDEESSAKDEKGIPDTKRQQQTGETTRSDRRL